MKRIASLYVGMIVFLSLVPTFIVSGISYTNYYFTASADVNYIIEYDDYYTSNTQNFISTPSYRGRVVIRFENVSVNPHQALVSWGLNYSIPTAYANEAEHNYPVYVSYDWWVQGSAPALTESYVSSLVQPSPSTIDGRTITSDTAGYRTQVFGDYLGIITGITYTLEICFEASQMGDLVAIDAIEDDDPELWLRFKDSTGSTDKTFVEQIGEYTIYEVEGNKQGIIFLGGTLDEVLFINNTLIESRNSLPFTMNFRSGHVGAFYNNTLYYFAYNGSHLMMWETLNYGQTWTLCDSEAIASAQNIVMVQPDYLNQTIHCFYTKTYDLYHHRFSLVNETFYGIERYTNMDGRDDATYRMIESELDNKTGNVYPVMISGSTANSEIRWRNSVFNETTDTWSAQNEESANDERGGSISILNYNSSEYRIGFQGDIDWMYIDTRVDSVTPQGWVFSQAYSLGASHNEAWVDSLQDPDSLAVYAVFISNTNPDFAYATNSPPYDETTFTVNTGAGNKSTAEHHYAHSMFSMNDDPYVVWFDNVNLEVYIAPATWFSGSKTALEMSARRPVFSNSSYLNTTLYDSVSSVRIATENDYYEVFDDDGNSEGTTDTLEEARDLIDDLITEDILDPSPEWSANSGAYVFFIFFMAMFFNLPFMVYYLKDLRLEWFFIHLVCEMVFVSYVLGWFK